MSLGRVRFLTGMSLLYGCAYDFLSQDPQDLEFAARLAVQSPDRPLRASSLWALNFSLPLGFLAIGCVQPSRAFSLVQSGVRHPALLGAVESNEVKTHSRSGGEGRAQGTIARALEKPWREAPLGSIHRDCCFAHSTFGGGLLTSVCRVHRV